MRRNVCGRWIDRRKLSMYCVLRPYIGLQNISVSIYVIQATRPINKIKKICAEREIEEVRNTKWNANFETSSSYLECLKIFVNFQYYAMKWYDGFNWSDYSISQGSVAARLRWGGVLCDRFVENFLECDSERIMKIVQCLMKLCVEYCANCGLILFGPPCMLPPCVVVNAPCMVNLIVAHNTKDQWLWFIDCD